MAFYVDTPTSRGGQTDDPALDFNLENMAENVINGMFCTYEPPNSTKSKVEAVKEVRTNPHKFTVRPRAPPKGILRYTYLKRKKKKKKNKKKKKKQKDDYDYNSDADDGQQSYISTATSTASSSRGGGRSTASNSNKVTWRDQQKQVQRTQMENDVVQVADKYLGLVGVFSEGEGLTDDHELPLSPRHQSGSSGASFRSGSGGRNRRDPAPPPPPTPPPPSRRTGRRSSTPKNSTKMGSFTAATSNAAATFLDEIGNDDDDDDQDNEEDEINTPAATAAAAGGGRILYDDEGNPMEEDDFDEDDDDFDDDDDDDLENSRDDEDDDHRHDSVVVVAPQSPSANSITSGTTRQNHSGNDYSNATATALAAAGAVVGAGCQDLKLTTGCTLPPNLRGPRPHLFCNAPPEEMVGAISPTAETQRKCQQNLMCSGFSFLETAMEAFGGGGGGGNGDDDGDTGIRETLSDPDIMDELEAAEQCLEMYEPDNYDQSPSKSNGIKLIRQPTPKHLPTSMGRGRGRERGRGRTTMQSLDDKLDEKEQKKKQVKMKKKQQQQREQIVVEDVLSPCNSAEIAHLLPIPSSHSTELTRSPTSDITMGNATIRHFEKNNSLYDEGERRESTTDHAFLSTLRQGHKKSTSSSGSIVEELKQLFSSEGGGNGTSQSPSKFKQNNNNISKHKKVPSADIHAIKQQLEKSVTGSSIGRKKPSVVTNSYLKSINTDRNKSPRSIETDSQLSSVKSGLVASLRQDFETRRRGADPSERRDDGLYNFGRSGILPPTPNNKSSRSSRSSSDKVRDLYQAAIMSPKTCATDDEIREEVSTVNVVSMGRPVMRHSSLEVITVGGLHENEDDDEYLDGIEDERRQDRGAVDVVSSSNKEKKSKSENNDDNDKKKSNKRISKLLSPKSLLSPKNSSNGKKSVFKKKEHRSFAKKFKEAFKKSSNSLVGSRIVSQPRDDVEGGEKQEAVKEKKKEKKKTTKKQKPPLEISIHQ